MNQEESFEDGVGHLMVLMEELKRSSMLSELAVFEWEHQLEAVVGRLDFLRRKAADDPGNDVKQDMYQHCQKRAVETCTIVFRRTTETNTETKLAYDDEEDVHVQASVARMTELCIIVHEMTENKTVPQLIDFYANYQKQVLRQRVKPAIAHLASWRQSDIQQQQHSIDDEDGISQPHSHALTAALGQASALIHPLMQWKEAVPPETPIAKLCDMTTDVLNDQAQTLVKTISDWFLKDKKIDEWMQQAADTGTQSMDLATLDALVEEMAFGSQVMARYISLIPVSESTIEREILPEWTWKYSALERFLGVQQMHSALNLATPVNIVMGLPIKVPSVVEDAQYLSTRALDRATSTRNSQAMGTVAHSLSHDIWSTDIHGGVYQALLEQRGCWLEEEKPTTAASPKSGDFASALLDAFDDDLKKQKTPPPSSAPKSGGFLGSLMQQGGGGFQQVQLETQLCAMNGILSASIACKSLVESLDTWLEEHESSMISLAREELMRYSQSYTNLLHQKAVHSIAEWCGVWSDSNQLASLKGKCLHTLRDFFIGENYNLDNAAFNHAETDERLEHELLDPLKESKLISQLDKCDAEVGLAICQEFSGQVAELIPTLLWSNQKRFTDWGSLLLSKQVRLLQNHITGLLSDDTAQGIAPPSFLDKWERMSQVVTILQLERPSDWSIYQATSLLTMEELRQTMNARVDFSADAIASVCQARPST